MTRQMIDYAQDSNDDLQIVNNDFIRAESTLQHQQDLLLCDKGDYKDNPTICVGAFTYLDDENIQSLSRAASIEFMRDGMQVNSIALQADGKLNIDAAYI